MLTPTTPPRKPIINASERNSIRTSFFLKPIAFNMPISLVRSVTDTIIILSMLIPATINDIPAIEPKSIPIDPIIDETVDAIACTDNRLAEFP